MTDASELSVTDAAAAFNKSIGFEDDSVTTETSSDTPATAQADRDALKAAAAAPVAGQSIETPTPGESNAPDYIKDLLAQTAALDPIDYTALAKEHLGEASVKEGETMDADTFYAQLEEKQAQEQFLAEKPGYIQYKDLLTRDYTGNDEARTQDDLALIQSAVRQQLGDFAADTEFDQKMAHYTEEGKLTDIGQKYANSIRQNLASFIQSAESEAKSHAKTLADQTLATRKEYREFVGTFKPFDTPLDDEDAAFIRDFALTGQLDQRLGKLTNEEIATIAIALTPALKAKYFALKHYERGANEGGKQKLAARLN